MKRLSAVAVVGMLAIGSAHPLIPAAALKPQPTATAQHPPLLSAPLARYKIKRPVLGVDLYAPRNYTTTQTFIYGVRTISYIKTVLHARAVGILWDYYAPSRHSNIVRATSRGTLTVADVMILTRIAERYGLQVQYRPLIFVPSKRVNPWEGLIRPPNPKKWFKNYFSVEWPYIKAAQKLHISEFVAETEMKLLNGSPLWSSFFRRIHRTYHGVVSYTAFYGNYLPPTGHLLPVRLFGMDMYKSMKLRSNASLARVTDAWESLFRPVRTAVLERTALDEEGIEARAGAYQIPPQLGHPGRLDQAVQANWFTAACRTVAHYHMRGVYFFKVDLADNPLEPSKALSVFEGRKGAVAIRGCAKLFR